MAPTLLVHPVHGCKHAYHPDEMAADLANGWAVGSERAVVVAPEVFAVEVPAEAPADEREALRAELTARGIEYDKRWGVARLREALA